MQVLRCDGAECRGAAVGVTAPLSAALPACMASPSALCFCVQHVQSSSTSGIRCGASGGSRRRSAVMPKGRGGPVWLTAQMAPSSQDLPA